MNGRIYDPEIGRFLSADPFVQFPHSTQGYNRYTYVGNNPLSHTDPSGFFLKKLLQKIAPILSIAANFIPGCQLWCSAAIGAAVGYLTTGTLKGAVLGGASAMAAYGIGEAFQGMAVANVKQGIDTFAVGLKAGQFFGKALLHGLSQGVFSAAGGGRFGDGFLGGASASLMSPVVNRIEGDSFGAVSARVVTAATVGGTAAKLGGGKFANGAISAAFVQAFNAEQHRTQAAEEEGEYKLALVAERSNSESDTGHVFVGGIEPDGSTEAYGFYPEEQNVDALYQGKELKGVVLSDNAKFSKALSGSSDFKMKVFTVDRATYDSAISYIRGYDQVSDYSLGTNSCVHAAFNTFNHVGLINSYSTSVPAVHPNTIYDAIKRGY
jgi:hypothetical protein